MPKQTEDHLDQVTRDKRLELNRRYRAAERALDTAKRLVTKQACYYLAYDGAILMCGHWVDGKARVVAVSRTGKPQVWDFDTIEQALDAYSALWESRSRVEYN